jgi:hypothetical protein
MTDLAGARITSLRTEGSRETHTPVAQPAATTRASSMDAARAALMRRMRRTGHDPEAEWVGVDHSSGTRSASYYCWRCHRGGWFVVKQASGGWRIDAIQICTGRR